MKKIIVVVILIVSTFSCFSQKPHAPNPYKIAFGVGIYPGLTEPYVVSLKMYTKRGNSFEILGYNLQEAWRLTALFNPYFPLDRSGKFRAVVGPGAHIGLWKDRYKINSYTTNPIVGLDGILGLEYRIPRIPISIQAHYQPSVDFIGNNEFFLYQEWLGAVIRLSF